MNTDHVIDKLARDISIGLQIGETQLWSALETITISGIEEVPDPGDSPTAVTVSTYYSIRGRSKTTLTRQISRNVNPGAYLGF